MALDPKCEAWVQRLVEQAPPLSERQRDLIAATFAGAITADSRATRRHSSS
jgi:hypothetical protein